MGSLASALSAKKASPTLYDKSTSKRFSYRGSFISVDVPDEQDVLVSARHRTCRLSRPARTLQYERLRFSKKTGL